MRTQHSSATMTREPANKENLYVVVHHQGDSHQDLTRISAETVVALLHRDGRCPEWIDVSVEAIGTGFTLLRLLCCGRYTDDRKKMHYDDQGLGPFGIKSPVLPPNYVEGSKFDIPHA